MDPLLIAAASGMKARMESLDMLANNISNSSSSGFKADRELFTLAHADLPLIEKQWTDFSQGTLTPTGNPLDLGLEGPGFFALNSSDNGVVYTRSGNFEVNGANQLAASQDGHTLRNVRDPQRKPIVVDPTRSIDIDRSGVVRQNGQELGQLEVVGFPDPAGLLSKLGGSYFAQSGQGAATPAKAIVRQGAIEQSNVSPADASVRLVGVMRQFEMLQRALALGAEMTRRTFDEVARVT
jgi:flagellar basal body rod protein FlgG